MGLFLNLPVPLTAAEIAAAVRVNLAAELARVDVTVSTRATPLDLQFVTGAIS